MRYEIGNKLLVNDIECTVAFVDSRGYAYVTPDEDGGQYGSMPLFRGLVFTIVNKHGFDSQGNKALVLNALSCGAV